MDLTRASNEQITEYTFLNLKTEIVLLEEHYREFLKKDTATMSPLACKDCIDKHLTTARGLAIEGLKYLPKGQEYLPEVIEWLELRLFELPDLKSETEEQQNNIYTIIEELKEVRLKVQKAAQKECFTCNLRKLLGENQ